MPAFFRNSSCILAWGASLGSDSNFKNQGKAKPQRGSGTEDTEEWGPSLYASAPSALGQGIALGLSSQEGSHFPSSAEWASGGHVPPRAKFQNPWELATLRGDPSLTTATELCERLSRPCCHVLSNPGKDSHPQGATPAFLCNTCCVLTLLVWLLT